MTAPSVYGAGESVINDSGRYLHGGVDYAPVFDPVDYLQKNPDVARAIGNDARKLFSHFVNNGMKEGRQAKGEFNVRYYLYRYPDLRRAYGTDLPRFYRHYCTSGKREGRDGRTAISRMNGPLTKLGGVDYARVYDYNDYVGRYADLKKAFAYDDEAALRHFINNGMREGRQAKASFKVQAYRSRYADLRKAYGSNLKSYYLHYIRNGYKEKRIGA